MPTINSIDIRHLKVPLDEVLVDARHGAHTHFELIVVNIETDDGLSGTGYTYTGGRGGHAITAMLVHDLKPFLLGSDPEEVECLHDDMQWHVHYVARGGIASFAISAIDIALWDLRGKRRGEPLWKMAGGAAQSCRAYRGGIDLNFSLPRLLDEVQGYLDTGFNGVKIKIGQPTLAEDVARVKAVRELIGPDCKFMVDANYSMTIGSFKSWHAGIACEPGFRAIQRRLDRGTFLPHRSIHHTSVATRRCACSGTGYTGYRSGFRLE